MEYCEICGDEKVIPKNVGIFELEYSPCPICGTEEDVKKFLEEIEKGTKNMKQLEDKLNC